MMDGTHEHQQEQDARVGDHADTEGAPAILSVIQETKVLIYRNVFDRHMFPTRLMIVKAVVRWLPSYPLRFRQLSAASHGQRYLLSDSQSRQGIHLHSGTKVPPSA